MKYLLFILALSSCLTAYGQCDEFDNLLKKGDNYLKRDKPDYEEAINAYTAAILACLSRADDAKQRIARMVNDINKLKDIAVAAQDTAKAERQRVEAALDSLKKTNKEIVRLILRNANTDILRLEYDSALVKVNGAAKLGELKEDIAKAYLELAFWFGEAGQVEKANGILGAAAALVNKKASVKQPFRDAIKDFNTDEHERLMKRYYPDMADVQGGTFTMGCMPNDTECYTTSGIFFSEVPPHEVTLGDFQIARTETTFWQFGLFCAAKGDTISKYAPSWGLYGDNPAVKVNWDTVIIYNNWLNEQLLGQKITDLRQYPDSADLRQPGYRLPTEAEWEYAAKGGQPGKDTLFIYSGSNNLDEAGWYYGNCTKTYGSQRTNPVARKKKNALGLYDMSGNVWEWVLDYPREYEATPVENPVGEMGGTSAGVRGGSWLSGTRYCRVSVRLRVSSWDGYDNLGFRCARIR